MKFVKILKLKVQAFICMLQKVGSEWHDVSHHWLCAVTDFKVFLHRGTKLSWTGLEERLLSQRLESVRNIPLRRAINSNLSPHHISTQ